MIDRIELIASLEGRVMGGVLHNGGYIHVPQEEAERILALLKEQETEIRQLRLALDIIKGTCKGIVIESR